VALDFARALAEILKIALEISHPAHVHFFKHVIQRLLAEGDQVLITARAKDVTIDLLQHYRFPHRVLSSAGTSRLSLFQEFLWRTAALVKLLRQFKPDVATAIGGECLVPAARLTGRPSVLFTDTEHAAAARYLALPWATRICTPRAFKSDLGPRQVRYQGYHELAYLHPAYFRPDPTVRRELGLKDGERFAVLRFVSWQASHDRGQAGFSVTLKEKAVERLGRLARVFISTECQLPPALAPLTTRIPAHRIHDVLSLASLYFGEGATMATEAGLLGTPSVYLSSLVGTMGNFEALGAEGLVIPLRDGEEALARAESLLKDPEAKSEWQKRLGGFLSQHIDVSDFIYQQLHAVAGIEGREARRHAS
jgi:hypothetical protein